VKHGTPVSLQEFTDDLRHRLQGVWRDVEGVDPQGTNSKLATYQAVLAMSFNTSARASAQLQRHLFLDLTQHVLWNVSYFRFQAHTLKVETVAWGNVISPLYDHNDCAQIQDEVHALLMCRGERVCSQAKVCLLLQPISL